MVEQFATNKEQPLTEHFIKNLNQILLVRPYWKDAITPDGGQTRRKITVGDYKKHPNSVRLSNGEIFNYASPAETPIKMGELIEWFRNEVEKKELHPIELAAILHYNFVCIHPFDDGNGRISRLLMNYVLLNNDYPPIIIKSDDKSNYLSALHDADTGNIQSFIDYISRQVIWSLEISLRAAKNESIEEEQDWKKKLAVLKKELGTKEGFKVKKSIPTITNMLNNIMRPFLFNILSQLNQFEDLFLKKDITYFGSKTTIRTLDESKKFEENEVFKNFEDHIEFYLNFHDFTKNGSKSFSISILLSISFEEYTYSLFSNEGFLFAKFYHQEFSKSEIEDILNECGKFLYDEIEKKLLKK
jgi:fido (protein-threonine AMPylation protein)